MAACGGPQPTEDHTAAGHAPKSTAGSEPSPTAPAPSGEVEAKENTGAASSKEIADLEQLCAALDKDYIDGTLSDYFAGIKSSTPWGEGLRKRANESATPGRDLEAAAKEKSLAAGPSVAPSCARLFDYLDDVE